jgi:hypothetical protein
MSNLNKIYRNKILPYLLNIVSYQMLSFMYILRWYRSGRCPLSIRYFTTAPNVATITGVQILNFNIYPAFSRQVL